MNKNPLISVIVPIYNSEAGLRKCLDSIAGQTYQDLEVILIDDGSTDQSNQICHDYAQKDHRFRLVAQKNQGSSAARNAGLRIARGEVIGFVDSDDTINPEMYEKLLHAMINAGADLAVCDVCKEGLPEHPDWTNGVFHGKSAIFSEFIHGRLINRVYNKLYQAKTIQGIQFPVGRNMMEDAAWTPKVLENAECVIRITDPLYYYTDNQLGQTNTKMSHSKTCSRFANILERESICLRNAVDKKDRQYVLRELNGYIRQIMESYDDLSLFHIHETLKKVVCENEEELLAAATGKEEKVMLTTVANGTLECARKQYRKAVWIYGASARSRFRLTYYWFNHVFHRG